jgi:hypothetical protein
MSGTTSYRHGRRAAPGVVRDDGSDPENADVLSVQPDGALQRGQAQQAISSAQRSPAQASSIGRSGSTGARS